MLSETQRTFLKILSDHLHDTPSAGFNEPVDWDELFSIADRQSLETVLYYHCKGALDPEIRKKYLRQYLAEATAAFRFKTVVNELVQKTTEQGIPLIFFKGAVFREYYPVPALRSMGDLDCVVREQDRQALDHILKEMGFSRKVFNHNVWTYEKGNIFIDAHIHMFYEYLANKTDYVGYFDRVWDSSRPAPVFGVESNDLLIPDDNLHFLYLMTHTAKHMTNKGSGFRAYLDMIWMTKACLGSLDWTYLEQELERIGLLGFTQTCFALCERWFNVEMPLKKPDLEDSFVEEAAEKTFSDGLFGLDNKENTGSITAKELKRADGPRWLSALKLTGSRIFPPYEDMQLTRQYSFVDGRPWLVPAAWVYRWGYCIVHKRKHSMDKLSEAYKKDAVARREEWLRQWKL